MRVLRRLPNATAHSAKSSASGISSTGFPEEQQVESMRSDNVVSDAAGASTQGASQQHPADLKQVVDDWLNSTFHEDWQNPAFYEDRHATEDAASPALHAKPWHAHVSMFIAQCHPRQLTTLLRALHYFTDASVPERDLEELGGYASIPEPNKKALLAEVATMIETDKK